MKSQDGRFRGLVIATLLGAACTANLPTAAEPAGIAAAKGGNGSGSPVYTVADLGALLGDYSSLAEAVNDAGDVVGRTCCGAGSGAFAIVAGAVTALADDGFAFAMSNGTPLHVAGVVGPLPVRWGIANGVAGQSIALQLGGATYGAARGVNDPGSTVGSAGTSPAIWAVDGSLVLVPLAAGFLRGEGRDINNAGHAVLVFNTPEPAGLGARAYFRRADGALLALPPLPGDVGTYANGLSEVVGDAVYVAGTSVTSLDVSRGVRWTINLTTGTITDTRVRPEDSHGLGVSDAGATAGFIEGGLHTLASNAFLWRGSELLTLKPPKGGKSGKAWAISPSGAYVAGEAIVGSRPHAMRWRILSP